VRDTIDLDNELAFRSHKVDDVSINRVLAAEFPLRQAAISQRVPQAHVRAGL